jgi:cytochrome b6-f complex iron-sulfur subunit
MVPAAPPDQAEWPGCLGRRGQQPEYSRGPRESLCDADPSSYGNRGARARMAGAAPAVHADTSFSAIRSKDGRARGHSHCVDRPRSRSAHAHNANPAEGTCDGVPEVSDLDRRAVASVLGVRRDHSATVIRAVPTLRSNAPVAQNSHRRPGVSASIALRGGSFGLRHFRAVVTDVTSRVPTMPSLPDDLRAGALCLGRWARSVPGAWWLKATAVQRRSNQLDAPSAISGDGARDLDNQPTDFEVGTHSPRVEPPRRLDDTGIQSRPPYSPEDLMKAKHDSGDGGCPERSACPQRPLSRRKLLSLAGSSTGLLVVISAIPACGNQTGTPPTGPVAAANVSALSVGTMITMSNIVVARDAGGVYAMSAVCTHAGCLIDDTSGTVAAGLYCPCHGSAFDGSGAVTRGPARAPLQHYAVTIASDGSITVDGSQPVSADTRTSI